MVEVQQTVLIQRIEDRALVSLLERSFTYNYTVFDLTVISQYLFSLSGLNIGKISHIHWCFLRSPVISRYLLSVYMTSLQRMARSSNSLEEVLSSTLKALHAAVRDRCCYNMLMATVLSPGRLQ